MTNDPFAALFSAETCRRLFPPETADRFFEALFGDAEEGSYDIGLSYRSSGPGVLHFDIMLRERPGRCLACNLTYGLPEVFSRHPLIDLEGLAGKVNALLGNRGETEGWGVGATRQLSRSLHVIPLEIRFRQNY